MGSVWGGGRGGAALEGEAQRRAELPVLFLSMVLFFSHLYFSMILGRLLFGKDWRYRILPWYRTYLVP